MKRIEADPTDTAAQSLANGPDLEDEDDEEDDDYEAGEDGETSSEDEDDDDEDVSEYVGTPSRR